MGIGASSQQQSAYGASSRLLTIGEMVAPFSVYSLGTTSMGAGVLNLTFFTAVRSEVITQAQACSANTAAAATPTLVKMGLYSVDSAGAGTLVASTASDTSLFASTNTIYTRSLTASFAKQAGQRYAFALLVVTGTTAPTTVTTASITTIGGLLASVAPRSAGTLAAQTDLPASFTDASLTGSVLRYGAVL